MMCGLMLNLETLFLQLQPVVDFERATNFKLGVTYWLDFIVCLPL